MLAVLHTLRTFVVDLFKPRWRLQAENLFLRHQLGIALRRAPPRFCLHNTDRTLLLWMARLWPNLLGLARVVRPEPSCGGTVRAFAGIGPAYFFQ